jgi:hypothetical protein
MAERDRNVAYALAVASVVIGGSGKDLALVTLEAIGVVADL